MNIIRRIFKQKHMENEPASTTVSQHKLEIVVGDITTYPAMAIVNAANETLLGGGGVDGAIHRAAGPELLDFCRLLDGCPTGEAKITPAFGIRTAHFIIHTPGPRWGMQSDSESCRLLHQCYENCLAQVVRGYITSVAFPSISTGIFHFPIEMASRIAMQEFKRFLNEHQVSITMVCFCEEDAAAYKEAYEEIFGRTY